MIYLLLVLLSGALSLTLTPLIRWLAVRGGVVDRPDSRKIHRLPVPRMGGLAVVVSAAMALIVIAAVRPDRGGSMPAALRPLLAGGLLVFTIGLWDDLRAMPIVAKLSGQSIAALLAIVSGAVIEHVTFFGTTHALGALAVPVTFVWIVGLTNAFNLVDGLDGLAAGLAVIASATCGAILAARGHHAEALLLMALLGGTAGFLRYNFHPASIFLGDGGSLLLGYVLAVSAITGWQKGATALAVGVPLAIFAIPILEGLTSVIRRVRHAPGGQSGEGGHWSRIARIGQADRQHIHHRLLDYGFSQRRVMLLLCGLSLLLSILALVTIDRP